MSLKLYGYWRSSASWRVRWALNLKNLECEHAFVNLKSSEQKQQKYLTVNPNARVPLMLLENGETLSQSLAMIDYVDSHVQSNDYKIIPETRPQKSRALELWEVIAADTHPIQNLSVQFRHSDDAQKRLEWSQFFIERGLKDYNEIVSSFSEEASFSLGDKPTLPDLALVPQIYNALRFKVDVQGLFPRLWAIYQNSLKTDECLRASPEKQPDAVAD